MFNLFTQQEPTGDQLREAGMAAAINHADRVCEDWSEKARLLLIDYIKTVDTFMTEDFRAYCVEQGLPLPPSLRAFGSVVVRAKRDGLIEFDSFGMVKNPTAHRTPATVWRSVSK